MSVDLLGTSCDQCQSMVQYSFTSTETIRLVRTDSPGRPPRHSHTSCTMYNLIGHTSKDKPKHGRLSQGWLSYHSISTNGFLVTQNVSCFSCSKGRRRERALLRVVTIHSNYAASFTPSRSHSFLSLQTTMPVLSLPHPPSFLYKLCRFFHSLTTTLLPFSTNIISINSFLSLQA